MHDIPGDHHLAAQPDEDLTNVDHAAHCLAMLGRCAVRRSDAYRVGVSASDSVCITYCELQLNAPVSPAIAATKSSFLALQTANQSALW